MNETCNDCRFEIIERAKKHILASTNIETSPEEMKVLDNFLFRCWQMGWLDKYKAREDGMYLELFAVKNNTRYNAKVVTMKDMSTTMVNSVMDGIEKLFV